MSAAKPELPSGKPLGITIIGSTGSIGTQTLEVIDRHPDRFRVVALTGASNHALLAEQAARYRPDLVVTASDRVTGAQFPPGTRREWGIQGLIAAATHVDADIVVVASAGHSAIEPAIEAIKLGKTIALANKEAIVCAGSLIVPLARQTGTKIHPVDSEHSAIWQSLDRGSSAISRLILTASGGPFLHTPLDDLQSVTVAQALGHPTWNMGTKVTIDSATMMNKGLELIEAHWLFDIDYDRLDVLIHPESIIHSIVEYEDCSQIAQLSIPDMRLPIQFALTYPRHIGSPCRRLDLHELGSLTFLPVDSRRFPAMDLAREAGRKGDSYPTVLSAADSVAVQAYLDGRIGFLDIVSVVEATLDAHEPAPIDSLETLMAIDSWSCAQAADIIKGRSRV